MMIKPMETTHDGIEIFNICDWIDAEFGDDENHFQIDIEILNERFRQWCEAHRVHYYARPREKFFMFEAIEETREKNFKRVIVEDLS